MVRSLTQAIVIGKYTNYSTKIEKKNYKLSSTNDDNVSMKFVMIMSSFKITQIRMLK